LLELCYQLFHSPQVCEDVIKQDCVNKTVNKCEKVPGPPKCTNGSTEVEVPTPRRVCNDTLVQRCEPRTMQQCSDRSIQTSSLLFRRVCRPVRRQVCTQTTRTVCQQVPRKVCKEVSAQEFVWVTHQECSGAPRYKRTLFSKLLHKLASKAKYRHSVPLKYHQSPVSYVHPVVSEPKCWPVQKWVPKEAWKNVCEDVWTQECRQVTEPSCATVIGEECTRVPITIRNVAPRRECNNVERMVCRMVPERRCTDEQGLTPVEVPQPVCMPDMIEKCEEVRQSCFSLIVIHYKALLTASPQQFSLKSINYLEPCT